MGDTAAGSGAIERDPADIAAMLGAGEGELQLIDVREPYERDAGHIDGSLHIQLAELSARAGELDASRPVVFYCRVGARSLMAAQAFAASGYEAYSMAGGLQRWAQEGRQLAPQGGYVAEH